LERIKSEILDLSNQCSFWRIKFWKKKIFFFFTQLRKEKEKQKYEKQCDIIAKKRRKKIEFEKLKNHTQNNFFLKSRSLSFLF